MPVRSKPGSDAPKIKPARQGDLDGLCGVYALINALELITANPPSRALQARLFLALTGSLSAAKLRKALVDGLSSKEMITAARTVFPGHKKALGGKINVSRPLRQQSFRTNEDFTAALITLMELGGTALIINFATPRYAHWTVVQAVKPDAIGLRDSLGTKSLSLELYTVMRGPYRILARETLMLQWCPLKRLKAVQDKP